MPATPPIYAYAALGAGLAAVGGISYLGVQDNFASEFSRAAAAGGVTLTTFVVGYCAGIVTAHILPGSTPVQFMFLAGMINGNLGAQFAVNHFYPVPQPAPLQENKTSAGPDLWKDGMTVTASNGQRLTLSLT